MISKWMIALLITVPFFSNRKSAHETRNLLGTISDHTLPEERSASSSTASTASHANATAAASRNGTPALVGLAIPNATRAGAATPLIAQYAVHRHCFRSAKRRAYAKQDATSEANATKNATPCRTPCQLSVSGRPAGAPGGNPMAGSVENIPAAKVPAPNIPTRTGPQVPARPRCRALHIAIAHTTIRQPLMRKLAIWIQPLSPTLSMLIA